MKPHGLLFLAMLVVPACRSYAPSKGVSSHANGNAVYDLDDGYGGDGGMDDAEMEPPPPAPAQAEEVRLGSRRRARRAVRAEMATPAGASIGPAQARPEEPTAGSGGEKAVDKPNTDAGARHIIYTAAMSVSVFNLEDAMVKAEAIPETYGGYIQSMNIGSIVLRVPSQSLRKVMDDVAEYGVVEQRSLQSQDVTAEFVDIESRLRALEETHKQLLALLSKARTVKEALEVRQALDRISGELEMLKGRMRQLENLTAFSTLSLSIQERGPHTVTPSSNDPFPWVNDLGVESTEWR